MMLKTLIIRILLYPFCVFLIYMGFEMIENYQNWKNPAISGKQLISGFGVIGIAGLYLVVDLLIIIRDFRKSR